MNKSKYKITALDVIIVILVLLVIFIVGQKLLLNKELQMPEQKIVLTFSVENRRDFIADTFEVGDPVYQKGAIDPLGTITKVEKKQAEMTVSDSEGNFHITEIPERFDTVLTVETSGFISMYGGTVVDNTFFYLNQYMALRSNKVDFSVRVMEVK